VSEYKSGKPSPAAMDKPEGFERKEVM